MQTANARLLKYIVLKVSSSCFEESFKVLTVTSKALVLATAAKS